MDAEAKGVNPLSARSARVNSRKCNRFMKSSSEGSALGGGGFVVRVGVGVGGQFEAQFAALQLRRADPQRTAVERVGQEHQAAVLHQGHELAILGVHGGTARQGRAVGGGASVNTEDE